MQQFSLPNEPVLIKKREAFAYQTQVVETIQDLEYSAIFLEQGLGKTKIALDLIIAWLEQKKVDTVLVIAKKSLIKNWTDEFSTHTHLKPLILTQDRRANYHTFNIASRVVLAHYEAINSELERLKLFLKTRDVAIILDESAKIKNPESLITKNLFSLSSLFKKRVIMTGTPVANRPYDIWAQIKFLDNGKAFSESFEDFKQKADLSNALSTDTSKQKEFETFIATIFNRIKSFSVRMTKDNGTITLPNKEYHNIPCEWEPKQYELYKQIQISLKSVVVQDGLPSEDNSEVVLKRMTRLLQAASNPRLIDESYDATPGKFEYLKDLVTKILSQKEKAIIWTSFTETADWLRQELSAYGATKIHGKIAIEARNSAIADFMNNPATKLLIATPAAAKEGLTLTVANHVIYYDRSFSLDDYLQSQDRIHRISQKKTCHIYNLIMENSIDDWVDVLLQSKSLAAKLSQGDISAETFKTSMSYDYGIIIKEILGIKAKNHV